MPAPEVDFVVLRDGKEVHEYWLDGIEIPSVSYVLSSCGFVSYGFVKKSVLDNASEFGSYVHEACRYYDEGDLDMDALSEDVAARLRGWIKFKKDFDFKPFLIEKSMSHVLNGMPYGMTIDRYGTSKLGNTVVEIKNTADSEPSHQIQLAAYVQPFKTAESNIGRFVVQLKDDEYKLHEYKDRTDERVFAAALAVTHWKMKAGIK